MNLTNPDDWQWLYPTEKPATDEANEPFTVVVWVPNFASQVSETLTYLIQAFGFAQKDSARWREIFYVAICEIQANDIPEQTLCEVRNWIRDWQDDPLAKTEMACGILPKGTPEYSFVDTWVAELNPDEVYSDLIAMEIRLPSIWQ